VRDRATLHLTQLAGSAGDPDAISPELELNLAAMEGALNAYLAADDTQQPFDVVSWGQPESCCYVCACCCVLWGCLATSQTRMHLHWSVNS
jgi:hypothetical protein